jgi:hypothetical protein
MKLNDGVVLFLRAAVSAQSCRNNKECAHAHSY